MTIEEMFLSALSKMTGYENDINLDREFISEYPGRPFLHITRNHGTHLIMLFKLEDFPKPGETVPYLFGRANQEELLDGAISFYNAVFETWQKPEIKLICYYDGKTVKVINEETGRAIVETYRRNMALKFQRKAG
jgi:hypothetical protein